MMQNIYKQAKIENYKRSKDKKLQNIYNQTKREYYKPRKQRCQIVKSTKVYVYFQNNL
jgi:hypothetical protein